MVALTFPDGARRDYPNGITTGRSVGLSDGWISQNRQDRGQ